MHERHRDKQKYFNEQCYTTEHYVIPFLLPFLPLTEHTRVLEIGCGHGGNLKPFLDRGCMVTGLDVNPDDTTTAEHFLKDHQWYDRLRLLTIDIYQVVPEDVGRFDLIVMKDVIEHIHDQERFMGFIKRFLNTNGRIFLGFPPWQMPFGGHQQVCENRLLSVTPYIHLLPEPVYKWILTRCGESSHLITELLEVKQTGLSIERFRRILRSENYRIEREELFLINPNYKVKFGLKPRRQIWPLAKLPFLRNFLTSCCYSLVKTGET
jgi:SAM-dependent methyltransferase